MAKTLDNTGIAAGQNILAGNVSQSIDAFTGDEAYDVTISGSLVVTGSFVVSGSDSNPVTVKGIQQANLGAANILINQASNGNINFTSSADIPVSTIQVKLYSNTSGITFERGSLFCNGSANELELYFYDGDEIKKVTLT